VIRAEAWRFGRSGNLIIAGDANKAFYHITSDPIQTDAEGWQLLTRTDTLKSNTEGKEVSIYLFNNSPDTSYFDDFSVTIQKHH
jgi:hypothetical protein